MDSPDDNHDIVKQLEKCIDHKLDSKFKDFLANEFTTALEAKFTAKIDALSHEIASLKEANDNLMSVNAAIMKENKELKENMIINAQLQSPTDEPAAPSTSVPDTANAAAATPKKYVDVLILSDSIFRHVGSICPKKLVRMDIRRRKLFEGMEPPVEIIRDNFEIGNTAIKKVVIPGARTDALLAEAASLHQEFDFGEIILHVGANYVPSCMRPGKKFVIVHPNDVIEEIKSLLNELAELFPYSEITYSVTLPQMDTSFLEDINHINYRIALHCDATGYGVFCCEDFKRVDGKLDEALFAKDGIHLGQNGIAAMTKSLVNHVKFNVMYDDDL